jgi:hypothetical protein
MTIFDAIVSRGVRMDAFSNADSTVDNRSGLRLAPSRPQLFDAGVRDRALRSYPLLADERDDHFGEPCAIKQYQE